MSPLRALALVSGLALVASRRATELAGLVGALVFADIYMIVTGLVGDLVGGVGGRVCHAADTGAALRRGKGAFGRMGRRGPGWPSAGARPKKRVPGRQPTGRSGI